MKRILIFMCAVSLVLLCGCKAAREIERGYFVTAIGFKLSDDKTEMILEILSPTNAAGSSNKTDILSGKGDTVTAAYEDIKRGLVKDIYFEHCGIVAIEGGADSKALTELLKFCNTLQSLGVGVYVVKTDDVYNVFDSDTVNESVGYDVIGLIKNTAENGDTKVLNQIYQIGRTLSSGKEPSLPLVTSADGKLSLEQIR